MEADFKLPPNETKTAASVAGDVKKKRSAGTVDEEKQELKLAA